jgi:hypothetical protein
MTSRASFGRRGEAGKTPAAPDKPGSRMTEEQRAAIRKVLWATPLIAALIIVPVLLTKLPSLGVSVDCSSKPAAQRGVFDINWCQAGLAAGQGAVRGVAGARGAR